MKTKLSTKLLAFTIVIMMVVSQSVSVFAINAKKAMEPNSEIKNVIVMIPDGTSVAAYTMARWLKSYDPATGNIDTSVGLAMDEMVSGLIRTYWQNNDTIGMAVDSAPAGTAYATGYKSDDRFIGVNPDSQPLATVLEGAKAIGKSTGIISTTNIQHATPASFSSHVNNRSRYCIIGEQQIYNGIDVILGGGAMYLTPPYRQDGEDMIDVIKSLGIKYVTTKDEMSAVTSGRIYGSFAPEDMLYEIDRRELAPEQPSISEMTAKAIELLSQNDNGFFLLVEAGKADWAAHINDPVALVHDIIEFDNAIKIALDFAKTNQNTMVIGMTDHGTGGISLGNFATGPDDSALWTYNKDSVQKFIAPLAKANLSSEGVLQKFNADFSNVKEVMAEWMGVTDLTDDEVKLIRDRLVENKAKNRNWLDSNEYIGYIIGPIFSERAYIGWTTHGHTGEDVVFYSYLPGDERITGVLNSTDIGKIMSGVWGVDLDLLTRRQFNDAEAYFTSIGATFEITSDVRAGGVAKITKGDNVLEIYENKNYVRLNGGARPFNSVVVFSNGKVYVPQSVLNLIR